MNQFTGFSTRANTEVRRFDFFFDRLEALFVRKGRGFSVFQADAPCVEDFLEGCQQRGLAPMTLYLSSIQDGLADLGAGLASSPFLILIQDLAYAEFRDMAAPIADRLVFPAWFQRLPICFFSGLGREVYESQPIQGDDLHRDFPRVINALLAEQALTLLERSNIQIASPESLRDGRDGPGLLFTPIEETMRTALEENGL